MPVTVRDAAQADLAEVAAVHCEAFHGFFLAKLGARFLRAYYGILLHYDLAVFCVACGDSGIVGFVVGYVDPRSFARHLVRKWWKLAVPVGLEVAKRPALLGAVAARQRRMTRQGRSAVLGAAHAELASLAVAPSAESVGIGGQLIAAFCVRASALGCSAVTLTTDADDNERVNRFYQRNGFVAENAFSVEGGRRMLRYWRML